MFDKRAMLVELTIRQWAARKHDKKVSREVDQGHGAKNAGRYNKQLIAKDALEPIAKKASAIRLFHYARTLPWGNNGQRLLPAKFFLDYRNELVKHRDEFNRLVDTFMASYPQLVSDARTRLGSLYDPNEYPPATDVRLSFGVEFDIFPVPTASDFRVDVANEERSEIAAQIEAATQERQANATKACYIRVRDVLQRMKQQCVAGKTRITDSLIEDTRDLTDMLDDLNIGDDPELTRIASEIRKDLLVDADDLRRSPKTRQAVGDRAAELLDSMPWS